MNKRDREHEARFQYEKALYNDPHLKLGKKINLEKEEIKHGKNKKN